jgi:cell wall assembly regulator SMI1
MATSDLERQIMRTWARAETWLGKHLPSTLDDLNPPAEEEELDEFEEIIKAKIPEDLRLSYLIHNGSSGSSSNGLIFGFHVLSISEIMEEWLTWKNVVRSMPSSMNSECGSFPEEHIKVLYANPLWIPITNDGSGNHIGVDLDPGPQGIRGQIFNFGRDENFKFVIGRSFGEFFEWVIDTLEAGNFKLEDDGEVLMLKEPEVSHFLDAVPKIFGDRTKTR